MLRPRWNIFHLSDYFQSSELKQIELAGLESKVANRTSELKPGHAQCKSCGFHVGDMVIVRFNVSD